MTKEVAQKGKSLLNQIATIEEFIRKTENYTPKPDFSCGMSQEVDEEICEIWESVHITKVKSLKNLLAKKNTELKNLK